MFHSVQGISRLRIGQPHSVGRRLAPLMTGQCNWFHINYYYPIIGRGKLIIRCTSAAIIEKTIWKSLVQKREFIIEQPSQKQRTLVGVWKDTLAGSPRSSSSTTSKFNSSQHPLTPTETHRDMFLVKLNYIPSLQKFPKRTYTTFTKVCCQVKRKRLQKFDAYKSSMLSQKKKVRNRHLDDYTTTPKKK